eukprot:m.170707 g.170707  ORF g.170707 m.170707 type:complete len:2266 (+) comp16697_c0_seq1:200-6997(+)
MSEVSLFLSQGLIPSLFGGLRYDPEASLALNTSHLYIWVALFAIPLSICFAQFHNVSLAAKLVYSLALFVLFFVIHWTSKHLHKIYDTQEPKTRRELAEEAVQEAAESVENADPPVDGIAADVDDDDDEEVDASNTASPQPEERVVDMIPLARDGRGPYVVMADRDLRRWNHGTLDRHEAEMLLDDQPIGSFLFRFSDSLICSFRDRDRLMHIIVNRNNAGYFVRNRQCFGFLDVMSVLYEGRTDWILLPLLTMRVPDSVTSRPPPLSLTYPAGPTRNRSATHEEWRLSRARRRSSQSNRPSNRPSLSNVPTQTADYEQDDDDDDDDDGDRMTPVLQRRLSLLQRNSAPPSHDFNLRHWRRSHRHSRRDPPSSAPLEERIANVRQRHEELAGDGLDLSEVDVPNDLNEAAKIYRNKCIAHLIEKCEAARAVYQDNANVLMLVTETVPLAIEFGVLEQQLAKALVSLRSGQLTMVHALPLDVEEGVAIAHARVTGETLHLPSSRRRSLQSRAYNSLEASGRRRSARQSASTEAEAAELPPVPPRPANTLSKDEDEESPPPIPPRVPIGPDGESPEPPPLLPRQQVADPEKEEQPASPAVDAPSVADEPTAAPDGASVAETQPSPPPAPPLPPSPSTSTRLALHQLSGADVDMDQVTVDLADPEPALSSTNDATTLDFMQMPQQTPLMRSRSARTASDNSASLSRVARGTSQSYRIRRHAPDTLATPEEALDVMADANADGVFTPVRGNSPAPPSEGSSRATSPAVIRPVRRTSGPSVRSVSAEAGITRSGRGSTRSQRSLTSRAGSSVDLATALSDSVERLKTAVRRSFRRDSASARHYFVVKHDHALVDATFERTPWVCDVCERRVKATETQERYRCHECLFDLCQDCYSRFKIPEMMHPAGTGDNRECVGIDSHNFDLIGGPAAPYAGAAPDPYRFLEHDEPNTGGPPSSVSLALTDDVVNSSTVAHDASMAGDRVPEASVASTTGDLANLALLREHNSAVFESGSEAEAPSVPRLRYDYNERLELDGFFRATSIGQPCPIGQVSLPHEVVDNATLQTVSFQQQLVMRYQGPRSRRSSDDPSAAPDQQRVYRWQLTGKWTYLFTFRRDALMALLDKYAFPGHLLLLPILATAVALLGFELSRYYFDVGQVVLWIVVASAQYSLLKSVQPDASASSIDQRTTALSRPIYFILLAGLALLLDRVMDDSNTTTRSFYGVAFHQREALHSFRDFILVVILASPAIFLLGLLPVWPTLLHHLLEQAELHIFGGSGTITLTMAFVRVLQSCVVVAVLFGFALLAFEDEAATSVAESPSFAAFSGLLMALSFFVNRLPSDSPRILLPSVFGGTSYDSEEAAANAPPSDIYDGRLPDGPVADAFEREQIVLRKRRLGWDAISALLLLGIWSALYSTTVFTAADPTLRYALVGIISLIGVVIYYFLPQLRAGHPFTVAKSPTITQEVLRDSAITPKEPERLWFDKAAWYGDHLLRLVFFPAVVIALAAESAGPLQARWNATFGATILALTAYKVARLRAGDIGEAYLSVALATLFFQFDTDNRSETPIVDVFFIAIIVSKAHEWLLKLQFAFCYNGPWHVTDVLGSGAHALLWPLSVPHLASLVLSSGISSILSAPFYPFMGSAVFLVAYFRPLKFWEKDYRTQELDRNRLRQNATSSQRNLDVTANELNALFYRHVLLKLRSKLARDIEEGRWGQVLAGDVFIMLDLDNRLTIFVHIIEKGDGYVSFQIRGLEFTGTFCQSRELEALDRDPSLETGCCCFSSTGRCWPNRWLSLNEMLRAKSQAWESVQPNYVLPGYAISLNSASSMFNSHDYYRMLINVLTQSVIYYALLDDKLVALLQNETATAALDKMVRSMVDRDSCLHRTCNNDYDARRNGVSLESFYQVHSKWIEYCVEQRQANSASSSESPELLATSIESRLTKYCFALSLMTRRMLLRKFRNERRNPDAFVHGFHALFSGTLQPESERDQWMVLADPELLTRVVYRGARMALRLHQDYFLDPEEYNDLSALYDALEDYDSARSPMRLTVCHEAEWSWRQGVLSDFPSLLSLRWNIEDSSYNKEFFIVSLTKRRRSYKVFKINRECVRGLWAAQQQEVLFLRNPINERGSIQNCKCVLRNMVSQSNDQPVGYPIYVSDVVSSFTQPADTTSTGTWFRQHWQGLGRWLQQACLFGGSGAEPASRDATLHRQDVSRVNLDSLDGRPTIVETELVHTPEPSPSSSSVLDSGATSGSNSVFEVAELDHEPVTLPLDISP